MGDADTRSPQVILHALTAIHVFVTFESRQASVEAADVTVLLGYASLILTAAVAAARGDRGGGRRGHQVGERRGTTVTVARAFRPVVQLVGLAVAVVLAKPVPSAILLIPFHLAALVADLRRGPIAAYTVGIAAALVFLPATRTVSFILWATGVLAADRTIHRARLRARTLELQLTATEHELSAEEKSSHLANALSRSEKQVTRLEERRRLSVEVHDILGHAVTGSLLQLEAARLTVREDPDDAARTIERVEEVLKKGMDAIRTSIRALKPAADDVGLGRIEHAVYQFERESRFQASLEVHGAVDAIRPPLWATMLANLHEAFTNCRKHSTGNRVDVTVAVLNRVVKFEVRDNGRVTGTAIRHGVGLQGMEERTAATAGTLIVDTSRGFSLICLWRRDVTEH